MNHPTDLKYRSQRWENYFIRDLWVRLNKEYYNIFSILGGDNNIGIYIKKDKHSPNYGFWFFFAQEDNKLVFKYRPKPLKIYTPKSIIIESPNQLDYVTQLCLKIIEERFGEEWTKGETKLKQTRSSHDAVFVPPTYENELYDKSQKDKIIEKKLRRMNKWNNG